jgi:hypothetical protein
MARKYWKYCAKCDIGLPYNCISTYWCCDECDKAYCYGCEDCVLVLEDERMCCKPCEETEVYAAITKCFN